MTTAGILPFVERVVRRVYAKQILASVGVTDAAVENAFALVERERYLGPGPWPILRSTGYVPTPEADPIYLYSDVLIGIAPERGLNNGIPSYHAPLMASAGVRPDEHVLHVVAGVGYYSAILAQLVGPSSAITAIELDPDLAKRAKANLEPLPNVQVLQGDGASLSFAPADLICVNAGATRPADIWLDGLKDGGR
jgi:protein-L-isoaspartate(D-aspartate) O-methyltransferase